MEFFKRWLLTFIALAILVIVVTLMTIIFYWLYQSAILAIIFLANSKYEFRLICPLLIFILQ